MPKFKVNVYATVIVPVVVEADNAKAAPEVAILSTDFELACKTTMYRRDGDILVEYANDLTAFLVDPILDDGSVDTENSVEFCRGTVVFTSKDGDVEDMIETFNSEDEAVEAIRAHVGGHAQYMVNDELPQEIVTSIAEAKTIAELSDALDAAYEWVKDKSAEDEDIFRYENAISCSLTWVRH